MPISGVNGEFRRYAKKNPHGRYITELWATDQSDDGNTT